MQYVKLTPKLVEDVIEVYEEDIQDYYKTNEAKFFIKKQYKASHILVKNDDPLPFGEDLSTAEKYFRESLKVRPAYVSAQLDLARVLYITARVDAANQLVDAVLKEDPNNHLLMHAMAPNVAGVIGSAVAAGILMSFLF